MRRAKATTSSCWGRMRNSRSMSRGLSGGSTILRGGSETVDSRSGISLDYRSAVHVRRAGPRSSAVDGGGPDQPRPQPSAAIPGRDGSEHLQRSADLQRDRFLSHLSRRPVHRRRQYPHDVAGCGGEWPARRIETRCAKLTFPESTAERRTPRFSPGPPGPARPFAARPLPLLHAVFRGRRRPHPHERVSAFVNAWTALAAPSIRLSTSELAKILALSSCQELSGFSLERCQAVLSYCSASICLKTRFFHGFMLRLSNLGR